jgi:hypothetical protein
VTLVGLRLALLTLLLGQPSRAAVSLVYEPAPELSCPDEATLRRLIAARLGNDPFVDDGEALVTVRLKAGPPVFADVLLESPRGAAPRRKSLSGSDCTSLLNSVAITVALTVDPLLHQSEPPPVSAPPLVVESPPAPAPVPAPVITPAPVKQEPAVRGSLSAGASLNLGLSLVVQPTLRLEGRLHFSVWSLGLEGRFGWPVSGALPDGGLLTTSTVLGAVVPCLTWRWLSGCADLSLGALRLEGQALAAARQATVFHASVGLRALFTVPLGEHFGLGVMAEGQVPLTRASALVGSVRVWTVAPVGGGLGLWATLRL